MSESRAPVVSVTIVLYNSAGVVGECLRSLAPDADAGFADVIVVDNDSPDDSAEVASRALPGVNLITSGVNQGFAHGANQALPHVRGRYWMLLNPDVVVPPGALRKLVSWMDDRPQIGIASPEIVDLLLGASSAGRASPSIARTLLEMSRLHLLLPRATRGRLLRGAYWRGGDQLDAGWVPGTAMIARREVVEQIGPLADDLFLYGEDLEWCWRARKAGWRIGVCSSVTVTHQASTSAVETFGETEARRRLAVGVQDAVRKIRGDRYASLYMRTEALALKLDAIHPGRQPESRAHSRAMYTAWNHAARTAKNRRARDESRA